MIEKAVPGGAVFFFDDGGEDCLRQRENTFFTKRHEDTKKHL
jgi:hypothetical protein